ncbi:MAG: DEAD/DEAH box helicase, partial [Pseudomonadota bacterium]
MATDPLAVFSPGVANWFRSCIGEPTAVQREAWPIIAQSGHVLATAPTGSGKTLTAFLYALDRFATGAWQPGRTRVLYVSPLKALNNDIQRNLLSPLHSLREHTDIPALRIATRSGDTPQSERQRLLRRPPDILITTPESFALMLTTAKGRDALAHVETLILDEVHAVADNRRGVSLATSAERLVEITSERLQRIALSATVEPLDRVAQFVAGHTRPNRPRAITIINPEIAKSLELVVRYPEAAQLAAEQGEPIWDALAEQFRDITEANRSTLFFTNSRMLAEKVTLKINDVNRNPAPLAWAHHGSLAREIRTEVERRLKDGDLRAIVATSSLEMGIDIGELDEVVMVQSPPGIANALQRLGRAGHQVDAVSRGKMFPVHDHDFLEAAVLTQATLERDLEPLKPIDGALDMLAQFIISCTATETRRCDDLFSLLQRAEPYRTLSRASFDRVLEQLAGRYSGARVRSLEPRIEYDRLNGTVRAKKSALFAFYNAGGSIPDRGYYQIRHSDGGTQIGELDEEFVWEAKIGDVFSFGTQHWQVQRITHNDVFVKPARPVGIAPPFWRAEKVERSAHFANRIAEFLTAAELSLQHEHPDAL